MGYSTIAKKIYGEHCELCSWGKATCDVHHIDYQELNQHEEQMREALDGGDRDLLNELQEIAFAEGWGLFDEETRQLSKNHNPYNLAVLCPNCHRELHHFDLGKRVLESLPSRRKISAEMIQMLGGL